MTRKEAIDILQNTSFFGRTMDDIDTAIDMAIKALEKQIPQKPEYIVDGYSNMAKCPNCGNDDYDYDYDYGYGNWGKPFCPECGQALDWSEEE